MTLQQTINAAFIKAFKAGEKEKKMTLSMVKAAITEAEKKEGKELTDTEVLAIIQSYDKKLDQTIDMLVKGNQGDSDLAIATKAEKEFIAVYLPAQMTEQEIDVQISNLMEGLDMSNKGKATGSIMNFFKVNNNGRYNPAILKSLIDKKMA